MTIYKILSNVTKDRQNPQSLMVTQGLGELTFTLHPTHTHRHAHTGLICMTMAQPKRQERDRGVIAERGVQGHIPKQLPLMDVRGQNVSGKNCVHVCVRA